MVTSVGVVPHRVSAFTGLLTVKLKQDVGWNTVSSLLLEVMLVAFFSFYTFCLCLMESYLSD